MFRPRVVFILCICAFLESARVQAEEPLPSAQYRVVHYGTDTLAKEGQCPSQNLAGMLTSRHETVAGYLSETPDFSDHHIANQYLRGGLQYFYATCWDEMRRQSPKLESMDIKVFLSTKKEVGENLRKQPIEKMSSGSAAVTATFALKLTDTPDKATIRDYYNPAATARERATRVKEDERRREKISRTVEGFTLGLPEAETLAQVRRGWNKEYLPYTWSQQEALFVPVWFSQVRSGDVGRVQLNRWISVRGVYFRTPTVKHVSLLFFQGRLYQIALVTLGEGFVPKDRELLLSALSEKYGAPATVPGTTPLSSAHQWANEGTSVTLVSDAGKLELVYVDRSAVAQMAEITKQRERELQEAEEKRRRTLPRGF